MSADAAGCLQEAIQSLETFFHPSLTYLILSHTFLVLLVPLVISLFYFSTPQSRRTPVFILNATAISLAFVVGVLCDGLAINGILSPLNPWPTPAFLALGLIAIGQSILVDTTLLVRVVSVYPPTHIGMSRFVLLIATPIFLKLARVANFIAFSIALSRAMNEPDAAVVAQTVFISAPYIKVEWAAQMIDNGYASLAFLWRLYHKGQAVNSRVYTNSSGATLSLRVRTLCYIALENFVVPTMFSIAEFICLYRNVSMVILNQVMLVNTMVATFGIAFATVWAGSTSQQKAWILDSKNNNVGSSLMATFGRGPGHAENQSSTMMGSDSASK